MKQYLTLLFLCMFLVACNGTTIDTNDDIPDVSDPVACTMDAKICPDGSAVGRVGPNCEFAPCPSSELPPADQLPNENSVYCTPEQRNVDACIEIYQPVCGWSDPARIQCITYPCASEYSNSCFACQDENVLYYTEGTCPSPGSSPSSSSPLTQDAGTTCTDSSQCESYCQAPRGTEAGEQVQGTCYMYKNADCMQEVKDGRAEWEWCN